MYGPNSTIYYGSPYLGEEGPCHLTPTPFYNPVLSSAATGRVDKNRGYAYGGNGKILSSFYSYNDTVGFGDTAIFPSIENVQVAIVNKTIIKVRADECTGVDHDNSILGLSEYTEGTSGPSFRQNLLDQGVIESSTLSMWFDEAPAAANATYRGTALFGAIPKTKYSGSLVQVPKRQPESSTGYYVDTPVWSTVPVSGGQSRPIKPYDDTAHCLLDSGSGQDYLPVDRDDFLNATGLIMFENIVAYNGSCDSIPRDAAVLITFGAAANGTSATVKVPLRNWARGNADWLGDATKCGLSMQLSQAQECTLGSPFFSAAFLAVNDEFGQIALAQGGVSTGALDGYEGLGEIEVIGKGQGLP